MIDNQPLVTYSVNSGEKMHEAVIDAFLNSGITINQKEQALHDQINVDALDGFDWEVNRSLCLITSLWDHQIIITSEVVEIYEDERT